MKTKQTPEGWTVIEGDLISGWVEEIKDLAHDKFLIPLAMANMPEGGLVLDIGANIGSHAVAYSRKLGPKGTLICFEPGAMAFECLTENSKKFECKTLLVNCAVCDVHAGTARHTVNEINVGGSTVAEQRNGEVVSNEVRTITIDGFMNDSAIDLPVSFIKIDVEGYEFKVLQGMKSTLKRFKPLMLIEMNSFRLLENDCHYRQIYDWLLAQNYSWRIVQPELKGGDVVYDILCWPNLVEVSKKIP